MNLKILHKTYSTLKTNVQIIETHICSQMHPRSDFNKTSNFYHNSL